MASQRMFICVDQHDASFVVLYQGVTVDKLFLFACFHVDALWDMVDAMNHRGDYDDLIKAAKSGPTEVRFSLQPLLAL